MGVMQLYLYRPALDPDRDPSRESGRRPFRVDISKLAKEDEFNSNTGTVKALDSVFSVNYFTSSIVPECSWLDYDLENRIEITFTFAGYRLDLNKTRVVDVVNKYLLHLSGNIFKFIEERYEKELFIEDVRNTSVVKMPGNILQEDLPRIFVSLAITFEDCIIEGGFNNPIDISDQVFYFRFDRGLSYDNFNAYFQFINTEADGIYIPTAREIYIENSRISNFYIADVFDIHLNNSSVQFNSDMPVDDLENLSKQRGSRELLIKYRLPKDINKQIAEYELRKKCGEDTESFAEYMEEDVTIQDYRDLWLNHLPLYTYSNCNIGEYIEETVKESTTSVFYTVSTNMPPIKSMREGTFIHKDVNSSCVCLSCSTGIATIYNEGKEALLTDYSAYKYCKLLEDRKKTGYFASEIKASRIEIFSVIPFRENYEFLSIFDVSFCLEELKEKTNSIYTDIAGYFKSTGGI